MEKGHWRKETGNQTNKKNPEINEFLNVTQQQTEGKKESDGDHRRTNKIK